MFGQVNTALSDLNQINRRVFIASFFCILWRAGAKGRLQNTPNSDIKSRENASIYIRID